MSSASQTSVHSSDGSVPSDGTQCGDIAVEYRSALLPALACDPAAPNACTEWRPLAVVAVPNGGSAADGKTTGLCYTSSVGYVTAQHTAPLDAIIQRYKGAGCTIGYCPGPGGIGPVVCRQNRAGNYTCGGW